jgi:predicted Rdx family selenoprotein
MGYLQNASQLADEVAAGKQTLTSLNGCETELVLDRLPQVVRFVEFTLLTSGGSGRVGPRYLCLQPHRLLDDKTLAEDKARHATDVVEPYIEGLVAGMVSAGQPAEDAASLDSIRDAVAAMAAASVGRGGTPAPPPGLTASKATEASLRKGYGQWLRRLTDSEVRRQFRRLSSAVSGRLATPDAANLTFDHLADAVVDLSFPAPFQPLDSPHGVIALCTTYEQVWAPVGYSRGELIGSLSLAPGEKLTVEVHSWDKSTRRTEAELAVESEMRTTEKLTQRDALSVVQEFARKTSTKVEAGGTIPIPGMPVKLGAQTAAETEAKLNRTTERLREGTSEAAATLKVNRRTRIESSRDVGREERQTRTLQNSNRCHTLNCQYFEVVSNYSVTVQPIKVEVCVLLKNPRTAFTLDWVLCHEGALRRALLDRTYLAGFDAAKALKVSAVRDAIEEDHRLRQLAGQGERLEPFAQAVADSYGLLVQAREALGDALDACGAGRIICIAGALTTTTRIRAIAWFALPANVRQALARLQADVATGSGLVDALRNLRAVVGSELATRSRYDVYLEINTLLGAFETATRFEVNEDVAAYDDAGLRTALTAAWTALRAMPSLDLPELDQVMSQELATARMEFDRLQCHLEEHWQHYNQTIWSDEDYFARTNRLAVIGQAAEAVENRVIGFLGDRAAYPVSDPAIAGPDVSTAAAALDQALRSAAAKPFLVAMPTAGHVMEAAVGKCDACEDYIDSSREVDVRFRNAKADQEEAERDRQRAMLASGDLSAPPVHAESIIVHISGPTGPDHQQSVG